jgi:membrane fusion protein (multidrug efflux system)
VTTPGLPHEHFTGQIRVVDPIIDPDTRTVQLIARVANPTAKLKSGMSGNVAVTLSERAGALVIPDEAVFAEGTQNFVFVVNPDSTVAKSAVQLGTRDSSRVEVLGGLEAGARVVRTGHQKLFPGAHVVPIPSEGEVSMAAPGGGDSGGASAAPASAKGGARGKK